MASSGRKREIDYESISQKLKLPVEVLKRRLSSVANGNPDELSRFTVAQLRNIVCELREQFQIYLRADGSKVALLQRLQAILSDTDLFSFLDIREKIPITENVSIIKNRDTNSSSIMQMGNTLGDLWRNHAVFEVCDPFFWDRRDLSQLHIKEMLFEEMIEPKPKNDEMSDISSVCSLSLTMNEEEHNGENRKRSRSEIRTGIINQLWPWSEEGETDILAPLASIPFGTPNLPTLTTTGSYKGVVAIQKDLLEEIEQCNRKLSQLESRNVKEVCITLRFFSSSLKDIEISSEWKLTVNGDTIPFKKVDKSDNKVIRPLVITKYIHEGVNTIEFQRGPDCTGSALISVSDNLTTIGAVKRVLDVIESRRYEKRKKMESNHDHEVMSVTVPLTCPLLLKRIEIPIRGRQCKHIQCTDLSAHLRVCHNRSIWTCSICGGPAVWYDLVIDKDIEKGLKNTDAKSLLFHEGGGYTVKS